MLRTCKQLRYEGGCDPFAVLSALEAAGVEVVESVVSMGDHTIVAVRDCDHSDDVEASIEEVMAADASTPHPVVGAVAMNHALFARRFAPPSDAHLEAAAEIAEQVTRGAPRK